MREIGTWRGTKPTKTEGGLGEEGEIGVGNVLATRTISHPEIGDKKNGLSGRRQESDCDWVRAESDCLFFARPEKDPGPGAAAIGMLARVRTMKGKNRVVYEREREGWDWGRGFPQAIT